MEINYFIDIDKWEDVYLADFQVGSQGWKHSYF